MKKPSSGIVWSIGIALALQACIQTKNSSNSSSSNQANNAADGGNSNGGNSSGGGNTPTAPSSIIIGGQVGYNTTAVNGAFISSKDVRVKADFDFPTNAQSLMNDGKVTIYAVKNGSSTKLVSEENATGSDGNYKITLEDSSLINTAKAADYLRVEAALSIDANNSYVVKSAIKPPTQANTSLVGNVSPETTMGEHIISTVAVSQNEDVDNLSVTPENLLLINASMTGASKTLVDNHSMFLPSSSDSDSNTSQRNAISTGYITSGEGVNLFSDALEFNREYAGLAGDDSVTLSQLKSYLRRFIVASCNFNHNFFVADTAISALAAEMLSQHTYTLQEISDAIVAAADNDHLAMNTNKINDIITYYNNFNSWVQDKIDNGEALIGDEFGSEIALLLNMQHGMDYTQLSLSTEFSPDQALAVIEAWAFWLNASGDPKPVICSLGDQNMPALEKILAHLLNDNTLSDTQITQVVIYNDEGFGCTQINAFTMDPTSTGHLRAEVKVYSPVDEVTGVTLTSTDNSALGGDGTAELVQDQQDHSLWKSSLNNDDNPNLCVRHDVSVEYTVTVKHNSDTLAVSNPVTRTHPTVPEASNQFWDGSAFVSSACNKDDIVSITTKRTLSKWQNPSDELADLLENNPVTDTAAISGQHIAYTYEFSHVDLTSHQQSPLVAKEDAPSGACVSTNSNRAYRISSFIPAVDCDPNLCGGNNTDDVAAENIGCRINIQTYYLDGSNDSLAQAAGNFTCYLPSMN